MHLSYVHATGNLAFSHWNVDMGSLMCADKHWQVSDSKKWSFILSCLGVKHWPLDLQSCMLVGQLQIRVSLSSVERINTCKNTNYEKECFLQCADDCGQVSMLQRCHGQCQEPSWLNPQNQRTRMSWIVSAMPWLVRLGTLLFHACMHSTLHCSDATVENKKQTLQQEQESLFVFKLV